MEASRDAMLNAMAKELDRQLKEHRLRDLFTLWISQTMTEIHKLIQTDTDPMAPVAV